MRNGPNRVTKRTSACRTSWADSGHVLRQLNPLPSMRNWAWKESALSSAHDLSCRLVSKEASARRYHPYARSPFVGSPTDPQTRRRQSVVPDHTRGALPRLMGVCGCTCECSVLRYTGAMWVAVESCRWKWKPRTRTSLTPVHLLARDAQDDGGGVVPPLGPYSYKLTKKSFTKVVIILVKRLKSSSRSVLRMTALTKMSKRRVSQQSATYRKKIDQAMSISLVVQNIK